MKETLSLRGEERVQVSLERTRIREEMGKLDAGHAHDPNIEDLTAEWAPDNSLGKSEVGLCGNEIGTRPLEGQNPQEIEDTLASWSFCSMKDLRDEVRRKWKNVKNPEREKGGLGADEN